MQIHFHTMTKAELRERTKQFHINVIKICRQLPRDTASFETGRQLVRSAGSVGANYRAALRAKSTADFIYKLEIVIEEADESAYWLEISEDAEILPAHFTQPLIKEANELVSILVSSVKTIKGKQIENSKS